MESRLQSSRLANRPSSLLDSIRVQSTGLLSSTIDSRRVRLHVAW
jgi:hypothetical protein